MAEHAALRSPVLNGHTLDPAAEMSRGKKTAAPHSTPKDAVQAAPGAGITKRKQSKSRNGCITCKNKRLKCDETKPACKQCAKRSVTCGGYKKDFKWRAFEEPSVAGKPPPKTGRDSTLRTSPPASVTAQPSVAFADPQYGYGNPPLNAFYPPPSSFPASHSLPLQPSFPHPTYAPLDASYAYPQSSPFTITPQSNSPIESFAAASLAGSHCTFGRESTHTTHSKATAPSSVSSGQSPRLVDLLLPGTDLSVPPEEYNSFLTQHEAFYQPTGLTPPSEDDVEEIPRETNLDPEAWVMRLESPTSTNSSSSSSGSPDLPILLQPQFSLASPENLTRRFDRDTCGVLSVKDGPTENPWRTLVWPLARDCPALYHAIASMTSFHQARDNPTMRIQGIDHMHNAVRALNAGLQNMRFDAAISTTLVLAFSDSWDSHISTGKNHIKGAKVMISQALVQHRQTPRTGENWTRLKFLCNTWIYQDVIARLTSADDDEDNDVDQVHDIIYANGETDNKLDPLMGCAHTLFPIIGRVAHLVRKVRRTTSRNAPNVISEAETLKVQLEDWTPPLAIEDPEDETTTPHDSIKTAIAYQYATLLYLHQAVPEMPSQSSGALAKRVLCELATVKPRSRSIIVQIFPLMAAGCEATERKDRKWVEERWNLMSTRMKLGPVEKCLEVTRAVWSRRDEYVAEHVPTEIVRSGITSPTTTRKRDLDEFLGEFQSEDDACWLENRPKRRTLDDMSGYSVPIPDPVMDTPSTSRSTASGNAEILEHVFTVESRLHWLGVMKDWGWEILLG